MEDVSNMTTEDINGVFQKIAAFENAKAVKEDIANGTAADEVKKKFEGKLKSSSERYNRLRRNIGQYRAEAAQMFNTVKEAQGRTQSAKEYM